MRYRTIVLIDLYYGLIDLYSSTRCDSLEPVTSRGPPLCDTSPNKAAEVKNLGKYTRQRDIGEIVTETILVYCTGNL